MLLEKLNVRPPSDHCFSLTKFFNRLQKKIKNTVFSYQPTCPPLISHHKMTQTKHISNYRLTFSGWENDNFFQISSLSEESNWQRFNSRGFVSQTIILSRTYWFLKICMNKKWNSPISPVYWFFVNPLLKSRIFQWTPKILKFFILNNILSFKSFKSN